MKKNTIGMLTAAIIFTTTGTGFMASNPYADVPAGDWSYQAVANLVHQGLVRGCSDANFDKNQILTRNEMAVLVAKAMSKENQADAKSKADIDQLVSEYAKELKAIGVEDSKLGTPEAAAPAVQKKDSKWDRLTFDGSGRIRFDKGRTTGVTASRPGSNGTYTPNSHINLDINYAYKVNDDWTVKGESEYGRQMNYGAENQTLQNSVFEQLYLTGPVGQGTSVKTGRYSVFSPLGMVYDDKVTGGQVRYAANGFAVTVDGGKATSTDDSTSYASQNYASILFDAPMGKTSNFHAGYYRIGGNINQAQNANDTIGYYSLGFDTKLAENLRLDANYSKSNADDSYASTQTVKSTANSAYIVKLTYRGADLAKKGSFDLFAMYRRSPQLASYSNTDDWVKNVKGFRLGGDYVVTKNMGLTAWYTWGKDVDTNETNDMYRFQWNFLI